MDEYLKNLDGKRAFSREEVVALLNKAKTLAKQAVDLESHNRPYEATAKWKEVLEPEVLEQTQQNKRKSETVSTIATKTTKR